MGFTQIFYPEVLPTKGYVRFKGRNENHVLFPQVPHEETCAIEPRNPARRGRSRPPAAPHMRAFLGEGDGTD